MTEKLGLSVCPTMLHPARRRATMSCMTEPTPSPTGPGSNISVRLDSRTDNELRVLAEIYSEQLGEKVTPSQIVRIAIHELHERRTA